MSHWFAREVAVGLCDGESSVAAIDMVMSRHGGVLARLDEVRAQTIKTLATAFMLDGVSASSALAAANTVVCDYERGLQMANATDYEDYKNRKR